MALFRRARHRLTALNPVLRFPWMSWEFTKNFVLRRILDEVILVPVSPEARQRNHLLVLNAFGAGLVDGIRSGMGREALVARAIEEFDAEEVQIAADVDRFLAELSGLGVIHVAPSGN